MSSSELGVLRPVSIVVLLSLFAGCDRCGRTGTDTVESFAVCTDLLGDVRFHGPEALVWNPVSIGLGFGSGDWVRTADDASLDVKFTSGTALHIGPGSTVVLELPSEAADERDVVGTISVVRGAVRATLKPGVSSKGVIVTRPHGRRLRVAPADSAAVSYQVEADAREGLSIAVTEGRANVTAGDEQMTLGAGQSRRLAGVDEESRSVAAPLEDDSVDQGALPTLSGPLSASLPEPFSDKAASGDHVGAAKADLPSPSLEGVSLRWTSVPWASEYSVEVAADQDFRNVLVRQSVEDATEWRFVPKAPGVFYWRVIARDRSGASRSSASSSVQVVRPNLLLAPENGVIVRFRDKRPLVTFQWRAPRSLPAGGDYEWVVAKSSDLSDVVARGVTDAPQARTRALGVGRYYWGVFVRLGPERVGLQPQPRQLELRDDRVRINAPKQLQWH